jgi:hypothetical protein
MSDLRQAAAEYLAIRRAMGFKLERHGQILADLLDHLVSRGQETITIGSALEWAIRSDRHPQAWSYYIELFYNEQGAEDTAYVTEHYLHALARQISSLNFNKWMSDRNLAIINDEVRADNAEGTAIDGDDPSTPTIAISGPAGQAKPILGLPGSWAQLKAAIKSVQ